MQTAEAGVPASLMLGPAACWLSRAEGVWCSESAPRQAVTAMRCLTVLA